MIEWIVFGLICYSIGFISAVTLGFVIIRMSLRMVKKRMGKKPL